MKILYISNSESPNDKKAWSGTMYKVYQSLCELRMDGNPVEVDYFACNAPMGLTERLYRKTNTIIARMRGRKWLHEFTFVRRNALVGQLLHLDFTKYDYVFVTAFSTIASAVHTAQRKKGTHTPCVYLADATFSALVDYYPEFSNVAKVVCRQANEISSHAIRESHITILSSEWAKNKAVNDYGIDEKKISVIEFGANIDIPTTVSSDKTYNGTLNVLLCGVHWERKGGDVAVECCRELIKHGKEVKLHIVGMSVPEGMEDDGFIVQHGFLNKNEPCQYERLVDVMLHADILLFPSKAECSAITLCEASGFGLPIFCYDTGGLANYVVNGRNGYRMPLSSSGKDFAQKIMDCIDNDIMPSLSSGSQSMYEEALNWNHWKQCVKVTLSKQ